MKRFTIKNLRDYVEEVNASLEEAGVTSLPPRFSENGFVRFHIAQTYGRTQVGVGGGDAWWETIASGSPLQCKVAVHEWLGKYRGKLI